MSSNTFEGVAEAARFTSSNMSQSSSEAATNVKNDILHHPIVKMARPFINGGAAGMFATTCIQPIDMIKVRLQLAGEGSATGPKPTPISVTREIIAQGKALDLYTGLSAGLVRQAVYTTARMGFYQTFQDGFQAKAAAKGRDINFFERATAGLAAGGIAAFLGNPADLTLIRMQSDGLKPLAERKNYKGVVDAMMSISKSEGITSLWAGATPTVVRAMALNFGQLAFFSEAKAQLKKHTTLAPNSQMLYASAIAGFFASAFSLPFDFVKTRLQKQQRGPDGKLPYKNMMDCFMRVARQEGLGRFYRGFSTYYVRIAPHAMITLIALDYFNWLTK
ncbi:mitochondrial carrier domain-containing protein [Xylariaceae sp. FL0016]|nr:mitochondrial carrier domain-containing protein [Xylariaceae sp. FL0016]